MAEHGFKSPLTELGRTISRGRLQVPEASPTERLRLVDQAIAAIEARRDLSEAQRARGLAALAKARARCLVETLRQP